MYSSAVSHGVVKNISAWPKGVFSNKNPNPSKNDNQKKYPLLVPVRRWLTFVTILWTAIFRCALAPLSKKGNFGCIRASNYSSSYCKLISTAIQFFQLRQLFVALIVDPISQGGELCYGGSMIVTLLGRNLGSLAKLIILRNHVRSHRSSSFGVSKLYNQGDKRNWHPLGLPRGRNAVCNKQNLHEGGLGK